MNPIMSSLDLPDDPEDCLNLSYFVFDDNNELQFQGLSQLSSLSQASEKAEADSTDIDVDWYMDTLGILKHPDTMINVMPDTREDLFSDQPYLLPDMGQGTESDLFETATPASPSDFILADSSDEQKYDSDKFIKFIIAPESAVPTYGYEINNNKLLSSVTGMSFKLPKMAVKGVENHDEFNENNSSSGYDAQSEAISPGPYTPANHLLSDDELVSLSTKELNNRMRNMPKDEAQELKRRRRTIKNRGYAQTCRHRRIDQHQGLQESNDDLHGQIHQLTTQLRVVTAERDTYKGNWEALKRIIQKK